MGAVLHVELVEKAPGAAELRFWRDNPNQDLRRTLQIAEIQDLVDAAESDYYSPLPAKLLETGQRLYRWLDGDERRLTTAIESSANLEPPVLVLAIATPHRLGHLPWEVLHDGKGFLLHAQNPAVLPVRWRKSEAAAGRPRNRPLQLLFMASSPEDVTPVLDYEAEEADIIRATADHPLDLTVEESGSLKGLGGLVKSYGAGFFDVLHLTGHAGHSDKGPVFHLEDEAGRSADATAKDVANMLAHRPPLVFVSGCRTGQNPAHGEVRSLAEQLVESGFRSVLGWGRPVLDREATLAAQQLYQELAAGESLPHALARTHGALRDANAKGWHLLRLFCAGEPPGALVTPLLTPNRTGAIDRPAEAEFLDPLTKTVKVAGRSVFVGRRRLLQRTVLALRKPEDGRVGVLLRGQGGRGKSSLAARVCDRLKGECQRVVIIGRLDETTLVNAWVAELPDDDARKALRAVNTELQLRIETVLRMVVAGKFPTPLFVLDDFEQNQPDAGNGDLQLAPHAADALQPLLQALRHIGKGRVLITCRYALPATFAGYLQDWDVPPLDATERAKQCLRLDQKATGPQRDAALVADAVKVADGNPRLFEWLHQMLEKPKLDHAGILAEMRQAEEKFRENILARRLIASLPDETRTLLGEMLLVDVPIPFEAVLALDPNRPEPDLIRALHQAADLSLLDVVEGKQGPEFRVPRQLGGEAPLLPLPNEARRVAVTDALFHVLYRLWWTESEGAFEGQLLELIQLASAARRDELIPLIRRVAATWLNSDRYAETVMLLEPLLDKTGRHPALLFNIGRAKATLGHGQEAGTLLKEAVDRSSAFIDDLRAAVLFHYVEWLRIKGDLDEVLRIGREELVPLLSKLGDKRARAVALGQIADMLMQRGQLDEALRIRRDEELPVYERLGDVRARAVALGKIADVLTAWGQLDEALRIRREEQLPVYERLGDVRARAVALGKIADLLMARGELEEALRIRREEQLPVLEPLGDVRELIICRTNLALNLLMRGRADDVTESVQNLLWAYEQAAQRGYADAEQIAGILQQLGMPAPPDGSSTSETSDTSQSQ